ncbi:MAG: hypothetical protein K5695_12515 [Oscillospiraceae bacterium]|nr:hypothetical protein [Oscillospiraceae bacterium]
MKHRAYPVPAALLAAVLLTGCGMRHDRTPAETDRSSSVADDARELATDAVSDGRELVSDAAQNGKELASDAAERGREIVSEAAEDVSDAMDKTDSDGAYRTDENGRVLPEE